VEIKQVPISQLIFDPDNARKHNQRNIDAIKGSLTRFGQQKPVVINSKNIIIAGNGTVAAAKDLGMETIKVVVTDLPRVDEKAFALADNRTSELAEWDDEVLTNSLRSLSEEGFNIDEIGFSLDDFLNSAPDYSVLEEETQSLDDMKEGVRKAIQIEFELEHYEEAVELVKFWRNMGANVGAMLIEKLKKEKNAYENNSPPS
jgi:Predicted transcriptional regulators